MKTILSHQFKHKFYLGTQKNCLIEMVPLSTHMINKGRNSYLEACRGVYTVSALDLCYVLMLPGITFHTGENYYTNVYSY